MASWAAEQARAYTPEVLPPLETRDARPAAASVAASLPGRVAVRSYVCAEPSISPCTVVAFSGMTWYSAGPVPLRGKRRVTRIREQSALIDRCYEESKAEGIHTLTRKEPTPRLGSLTVVPLLPQLCAAFADRSSQASPCRRQWMRYRLAW